MGINIEDAIVDDIEAKFNSIPATRGQKLYALFAVAENGEIVSFQPGPDRVTVKNIPETQFIDLPNKNLVFFEELTQSPMYWYRDSDTAVPVHSWGWKEGGQKVCCSYSAVESGAPALTKKVKAAAQISSSATKNSTPRVRRSGT